MISLKKILNISLLLLLVISLFPVPSVNAGASFNTDSQDRPLLQVANHTKNPGCTSCWATSVYADNGDEISFAVYYHNTSNEIARNVRIRANLPSEAFDNRTISVNLLADNTSSITDSVNVNLSSRQELTFIPGTVKWYPNQGTNYHSLPFGQSDNLITTSSGLNIGDLEPGWGDQGYLVFRARVGNADNDAPTAFTNPANGIAQNSAVLNSSVNPNGNYTTIWFEYGTTLSLVDKTYSQYLDSHNIENVNAMASGLNPETKYYFRVVARNAKGTTYGNILSFTTSKTVAAPAPVYIAPTATYNPPAPVNYTPVVTTYNILPDMLGIIKDALDGPDELVTLILTLDDQEARVGDEVNLNIYLKNKGNFAVSDVALKIDLPVGIEYINFTEKPFEYTNGEVINYNLGTINVDESKEFDVTFRVGEKVKAGTVLEFKGYIDYENNEKILRIVEDTELLDIIIPDGLTASIFSTFESLFGPWFGYMMFGIFLGFILTYLFYVK